MNSDRQPDAADEREQQAPASVVAQRRPAATPTGSASRDTSVRNTRPGRRQHIGRDVVDADHQIPDQNAEGERHERQHAAHHPLAARALLRFFRARGGRVVMPRPPPILRRSSWHGLDQRLRHRAAQRGIFRRGAERFGARIGRIDRELGEHAAGPRRHHDDAARQIDRLEHRMGDEDHGLAHRSPQLQQIVVELEAGDLVERGERLVHQQQLRLRHQRARDRDPHLHAAGQFARIGIRRRPRARRAPAPRGCAAWRRRGRRRRASAADRHCPRHSPTASASAPGTRSRSRRRAIAALCRRATATSPARRLEQPGDDAQRRRLAAAGRAEQRDEFTLAHVEGGIAQGDDAVREASCRRRAGRRWPVHG